MRKVLIYSLSEEMQTSQQLLRLHIAGPQAPWQSGPELGGGGRHTGQSGTGGARSSDESAGLVIDGVHGVRGYNLDLLPNP